MSRIKIITSAEFGALVDRTARNMSDLAKHGLVASPEFEIQGRDAWESTKAIAWFASLHDHAVIVPGNDLAAEELANHGVYICPLTSNHVGLARPRRLLIYRSGSADVFDVEAIETVNQKKAGKEIPGTRTTSQKTEQIVRDGAAIADAPVPYTVFYLRPAGSIGSVAPVVQQGRYVPLSDIDSALESGELFLTKLDVAFPPIE